MNFTKPDGKKYVDLCIDFDREFYEPDRNDDKLFQYMCIIFRMLAFKKGYFKNFRDYDGFAQFAGSICYMRFIKKQANGERVKSMLNYAKKSLYGLKVMYQNEMFNSTTELDAVDEFVNEGILNNMRDSVQTEYARDYLVSEVYDELARIIDILDDVVDSSPYSKDEASRRNLRISCMLTLLSQITLSNENVKKLKARLDSSMNRDDEYFIKLMESERFEEPILWNVPKTMGAHVSVLVNKVRKKLGEEINETRERYTLPDDVLDSVVASTYSEMFPESDKTGEARGRSYEEEQYTEEP